MTGVLRRRRTFGHREHTQGEQHVTMEADCDVSVSQRVPTITSNHQKLGKSFRECETQPTPWFWTSGLQNLERLNLLFKPLSCWHSVQQPQQTITRVTAESCCSAPSSSKTPSCLCAETAGVHLGEGPLRSKMHLPLTLAPSDLCRGLRWASPKGDHP